MTPIYAIGDIHGHAGEMHRQIARIADDRDHGAPVVFLGDYVDRGPDSCAVLQTLIDGQAEGQPWITLKGNHDHIMLDFLSADAADGQAARVWLEPTMGGRATLASYGVDADARRPVAALRAEAQEAVPRAHRDFLAGLALMHVTQEQVFVHAGIRPGVPLEKQLEQDLIWIRDGFLDHDGDFGRLVVHGHTALRAPCHYGNRLNLDGGAGYGRPLAAALIEGRDAHLLTQDGRSALH